MRTIRPGILFIALIGVALALLAGMSGGARSLQATAAAAQSVQLAPTVTPPQVWSFEIDESTLTRDMNAWADAQPAFQTPVGSIRLHDLSAQLHTDLLVVQGKGELEVRPTSPIAARTTDGRTSFAGARLGTRQATARDSGGFSAAFLGGMAAPLTLSASATVESGRAMVHVHEARLAGADLPESARGELQQRLQDQIDQATATFHVVVQSISIGEGTLALRGVLQ